MRRMDASLRKASALRLRFSQSFASRRQRLSQAIVRSTIQRFGSATNPDYATFSQEQLNIPQAEAEHMVQPDSMTDDLGGKAMAVVRVGGAVSCPQCWPSPVSLPDPVTVTMPRAVLTAESRAEVAEYVRHFQ